MRANNLNGVREPLGTPVFTVPAANLVKKKSCSDDRCRVFQDIVHKDVRSLTAFFFKLQETLCWLGGARVGGIHFN